LAVFRQYQSRLRPTVVAVSQSQLPPHSLTSEHIERNFVNWFPIWDIIFGTAVVPCWRELPSTVAGISVGSLRQAYLLPFAGWRRMKLRPLRQHTGKVPGASLNCVNRRSSAPQRASQRPDCAGCRVRIMRIFPGTSRRVAHLTGGGSNHGTAGSQGRSRC